MPGTCVCGEPDSSSEQYKSVRSSTCPATISANGDTLYPSCPDRGPGCPPPTGKAGQNPLQDVVHPCSSAPGGFVRRQRSCSRSTTMSDKDRRGRYNEGPKGDPAWLTISTQDEASCEECCGMPIRSDTPIAELAREWIRFRNAEDTGLWAPRPEDGIYPDSPSMLRFVHFMRSQYGDSGEGTESSVWEAKTDGFCPPSCPNIAAAAGGGGGGGSGPRARSPQRHPQPPTTTSSKQRLRWGAPPPSVAGERERERDREREREREGAGAAGLSPLQEERERIGEIAQELRRAVQSQSGGSKCPPTCTKKKKRSPSPPQKKGANFFSAAAAEESPYDYRTGDEEGAGYYEDPPRATGSRYWVDDETAKCYGAVGCACDAQQGCHCYEQGAGKGCAMCCSPCVKRNRSSSQCSACTGGCAAAVRCVPRCPPRRCMPPPPCMQPPTCMQPPPCMPPPPPCMQPPPCMAPPCMPPPCVPASCSQSPVAVFNFNECAATFQQHLHGQEDCDPDCPGAATCG